MNPSSNLSSGMEFSKEMYRVLFLLPAWRYVSSAAARDEIVRRIRSELLENGPMTRQTALLTLMLETSRLLPGYFSDYERKELKKRLARLHEEQEEEWKSIFQIQKTIEEMDIFRLIGAAV